MFIKGYDVTFNEYIEIAVISLIISVVCIIAVRKWIGASLKEDISGAICFGIGIFTVVSLTGVILAGAMAVENIKKDLAAEYGATITEADLATGTFTTENGQYMYKNDKGKLYISELNFTEKD